MSSKNSSFIFINQINFTINNQAAIAETTVHEIAHQFKVMNMHIDRTSSIPNVENTDICKYKSYMRFSDGGLTISGGEPLMQP